jgi:hypothetical protein
MRNDLLEKAQKVIVSQAFLRNEKYKHWCSANAFFADDTSL